MDKKLKATERTNTTKEKRLAGSKGWPEHRVHISKKNVLVSAHRSLTYSLPLEEQNKIKRYSAMIKHFFSFIKIIQN